MITCKICEKDVPNHKLSLHSQKCREVSEYKELLLNIIAKMEAHGDKALCMKNTLETHATRQQKKQTKKSSLKEHDEIPYISRIRSCNTFRHNMSPKNKLRKSTTEFPDEFPDIEEEQISTVPEICEEPAERMSDDAYRKFVQEVKRSMMVLKNIIINTQNITNWAFEFSSMSEVSHATQIKFEEFGKEIKDESILKFLKSFRADLESYIITREKYLDALHSLALINSPNNYTTVKQRVISTRAQLLKKENSLQAN